MLYDAVALLVAKEGLDPLADNPAARDFVADAFAHSKFIAYSAAGKPFLSATLGEDKLDKGFIELRENKDVAKLRSGVSQAALLGAPDRCLASIFSRVQKVCDQYFWRGQFSGLRHLQIDSDEGNGIAPRAL